MYDNSPMVVREAAAMKTPSVLVRNSSSAEGITDGYNGFLCQENSTDLARVLKKALFEEKEKLLAVGKNAQKTIPVSWENIMVDVEEKYFALMTQKHKSHKQKRKNKSL